MSDIVDDLKQLRSNLDLRFLDSKHQEAKPMELLGIPIIRRNPPLNQEEVTILCGTKAEVFNLMCKEEEGHYTLVLPWKSVVRLLEIQIDDLYLEIKGLKKRLAVYEPEQPC